MFNERMSKIGEFVQHNLDSKLLVHHYFDSQLEESFSGNGIRQVGNHRSCSSYITNPPPFWSTEEYIRAIQLRTNLLPSKSIPSNPASERWCRAGYRKKESLILQNCPASHWEQIHRHDYVVHRIAKAAWKKRWTVLVEPKIRGTDRIMRSPDLIMSRDDDVIICDVGIHWEGPNPLSTSYENKQALYSVEPFIDVIKNRYIDKNIPTLPI